MEGPITLFLEKKMTELDKKQFLISVTNWTDLRSKSFFTFFKNYILHYFIKWYFHSQNFFFSISLQTNFANKKLCKIAKYGFALLVYNSPNDPWHWTMKTSCRSLSFLISNEIMKNFIKLHFLPIKIPFWKKKYPGFHGKNEIIEQWT